MASLDRRQFVTLTGTAAGMSAVHAAGCGPVAPPPSNATDEQGWNAVRGDFDVAPSWIHLAGLLFATHSRPVREAIERHRHGFDQNPAAYVGENSDFFEREVPRAAALYLGVDPEEIALTDSTTMGIGLVYNGIDVKAGQEILTTEHDYHATYEAIDLKAQRTGASLRRITLYDESSEANVDEIAARIERELRAETRVLALTWVHSRNGVKIPLRRIADVVEKANGGRSAGQRILMCVDGVHGLGLEDVDLSALGCDFFMAGTHKWIFGPRGTGIIWGKPAARDAVGPTIPTFTRQGGWGGRLTPGGFHSFEHRWALAPAFEWNQHIGRGRIAERVTHLASQFKEALRAVKGVTIKTPTSPELSAGIIAFEVAGMSSGEVDNRLRSQGIISARAPYSPSYARITPGLLNDASQIEPTIAAIAALAA
jgi:isopenicillin-N epimerase